MTAFQRRGSLARVRPAFPAVTCTAQSDYLTGQRPSRHGIVANGWYNRELAEVQFWKQSNHLVQAPKIWETLRARVPGFTCATLFWWFNMYSSADYSITPRPMYPADGRKIFDIYSWPYGLGTEIKRDLGEFPFPGILGPGGGCGLVPVQSGRRFAVDRRVGQVGRAETLADAQPGLPAAPGLQPAAAGAGPSGHRPRPAGGGRIVGDLLEVLRGARRGGVVALGIWHRAGEPAGASEPPLSRARLADGEGGAWPGIARCRQQPRVCGRRPPGGARLSQ